MTPRTTPHVTPSEPSRLSTRAATGSRPTLAEVGVGLGYVRMPSSDPPSDWVVTGMSVLESFASDAGFRLGEVFVDDQPGLRLGWGSLVEAVRMTRPAAVLVPDIPGWRFSNGELKALRAQLHRVTNAPLVVARPPSGWSFPATSPLPDVSDQHVTDSNGPSRAAPLFGRCGDEGSGDAGRR